MGRERPGTPLQTTELVNEVYLKLVDCSRVRWQDRAHFFAISAQLMRRILVDLARSRNYAKRGGEAIRVTFEKALEVPGASAPDWIALDDALNALQALDARKCRMVELRFLADLNVEETAEVLGVSPDTIHRDWRFVKTWLRRELIRGTRDHERSGPIGLNWSSFIMRRWNGRLRSVQALSSTRAPMTKAAARIGIPVGA